MLYTTSETYGDPCKADWECNTGLYTKKTIGGFICGQDRTCACASHYKAVSVSIVKAAWGSSKVPYYIGTPKFKTYCVLASNHTGNLQTGSNCTIEIVDKSASNTRTCQSGHSCLVCPMDAEKAEHGACYRFGKFFQQGLKFQNFLYFILFIY